MVSTQNTYCDTQTSEAERLEKAIYVLPIKSLQLYELWLLCNATSLKKKVLY